MPEVAGPESAAGVKSWVAPTPPWDNTVELLHMSALSFFCVFIIVVAVILIEKSQIQ